MGLSIERGEGGPRVTAPARLWLTADKDRLVADGHPEAAFLFCSEEGQEIDRADAERYGLLEPEVQPPVEAAEEGELAEKQAARPADKRRKRGDDKAA